MTRWRPLVRNKVEDPLLSLGLILLEKDGNISLWGISPRLSFVLLVLYSSVKVYTTHYTPLFYSPHL